MLARWLGAASGGCGATAVGQLQLSWSRVEQRQASGENSPGLVFSYSSVTKQLCNLGPASQFPPLSLGLT